MKKIPVYFMPGLAASSSIFEHIHLPTDAFEVHLLEWIMPNEDESLENYSSRVAALVTLPNPVLIGVSFGGIIVQEMARHLQVEKVIIISSVKSKDELPTIMKFAKATASYKLLPIATFLKVENTLRKYPLGNHINSRLELYEKYLSVRDPFYLKWSIDKIVHWNREEADPNVVHINGDQDEIFAAKNIKDYIKVKGGTHIMIINRYKWFNENLPRIILEDKKNNILE